MLCAFEKYVAKNQLIFLFKKAGYWGISGNTNWASSSKIFILLFVNHQMTIRNSILLIRYNNTHYRVNSESIVVPQKYTKESASFP
jgi:hypothetical protein